MQTNFTQVKVRFNEAIAGLADPNRAALDRDYEKIRKQAEERKREAESRGEKFSMAPVLKQIEERKKADRYDDVCRGFPRDFAFKAGDEAMIPATVAEHWQEAGICTILDERKKAA